MRVALASYECKNKDIAFNLSQLERGLKEVSGKADLLCFGEAFLQGFDALCWDYETDKEIAVSRSSELMQSVCALSQRYGTDLLFGYIEREEDTLYSSCAVIANGCLVHNYRRISRGWKEYWHTDGHYREGDCTAEFLYKGHRIMLALCGDMWDYPERFKTEGILIWPVFVDFTLEEWQKEEEAEYARQALLAADRVLMVDAFCRESKPENVAGTFYFRGGAVAAKTDYTEEGILIAEL